MNIRAYQNQTNEAPDCVNLAKTQKIIPFKGKSVHVLTNISMVKFQTTQ